MRSRKVFRIYALLPEEERQAFGRFLASPYFNKSQRLADFRNLLEQALVQQPDQQLSAAEVWDLLPGVTTAYRPNGFDKLCAELLSAMNEFLGMQAYRAHPATVAHHQLQAYHDHGLDEYLPAFHESLLEKLGDELTRDHAGLYAHAQLLHTYARHLFRVERMPPIAALLAIDRKLNEFYFAGKLELAAAIDAFNRAFHSDQALSHLDMVKAVFSDHLDGYPLLIQAQAHAWLMTREQDPSRYYLLRDLLRERADELPSADVEAFYRLALNFCMARVSADDEEFEGELDDLHMHLIENGKIFVDGKLNPTHLRNIVQLRLRIGMVDWVEKFLDKWGGHLTQDHSGSALRYNIGVLAFYQGDYSKCLREMETVLRDLKADVYYGIDARIYSLKAIFELNKNEDWEQEYESRLNALRLYLIRDQKIEESRRQRRLNLVKQFRKLLSLHREPHATRRQKAKQMLLTIESLKPSTNRNWFNHQISGYL